MRGFYARLKNKFVEGCGGKNVNLLCSNKNTFAHTKWTPRSTIWYIRKPSESPN